MGGFHPAAGELRGRSGGCSQWQSCGWRRFAPTLRLAAGLPPCQACLCGSVSLTQSGEIEIVNHKSKDKCQLKFTPYSYFSRDIPRKVRVQQPPCSLWEPYAR